MEEKHFIDHDFSIEDLNKGFWDNDENIFSMEMGDVCRPEDDKNYKVRMIILGRDHGYIDRIRDNDENPAHVTIFPPGISKPNEKDVLAKLNITNSKAPTKIYELDELLYDCSNKFTGKHKDSVLYWCKSYRKNVNISNWDYARELWVSLHPNTDKPPLKKKK